MRGSEEGWQGKGGGGGEDGERKGGETGRGSERGGCKSRGTDSLPDRKREVKKGQKKGQSTRSELTAGRTGLELQHGHSRVGSLVVEVYSCSDGSCQDTSQSSQEGSNTKQAWSRQDKCSSCLHPQHNRHC
mgnify:CR=1 FL=1